MHWAVSHDRAEHARHGSGPLCVELPPACSISRLRVGSSLEEKRVPDDHPVRMGLPLPRAQGLQETLGGVTLHVDDAKDWRRPHDL
jgi:hypothetical protein